MWTDEELKEHGERFQVDLPGYVMPVGEREHRARFAELNRLARLGLAAEQVGRENLTYADSKKAPDFHRFKFHEAWRK